MNNQTNIDLLASKIVRVFSYLDNGAISSGTGFYVSENGLIITCCHALFDLSLRDSGRFVDIKGLDVKQKIEKVSKFVVTKIKKIEIESVDGKREKVILKEFDYFYDFALLKSMKSSGKKQYLELELGKDLNYLDDIIFCGFPETPYYTLENTPFTVNSARVSSFPKLVVGGEKYEHIQLNGVNLGGNSGTAIIGVRDGKVYGIVNGNFIKSKDDLAVFQDVNNPNLGIKPDKFVVPLGITYATSLTILKKSDIFQRLLLKLKINNNEA